MTHGDSYTRLYGIWCGMKSRCKGTSGGIAKRYYAERGISVCDEWRSSYESFRDWAIVSGYADNLELDRKDNQLGYSPENCRWATRAQQMQNTRKRCDGLSKYRGVAFLRPTGRWRAVATANGKPLHLGVFAKEEDAALAYDYWARKNYGEFASLNFPALSHGGVPS